jgi:hypothetical protein
VRHLRVCLSVCLCVRAPARVHMCTSHTLNHSFTHIHVCMCVSLVDDSLQGLPFSVCCVHLAVLGTGGGCLASSTHEWLLQRLVHAAVIAQRGVVLRP